MKPVLVSQRVDIFPDRNERRDCLDQRVARFLYACGFLAVPVPNDASLVPGLWDLTEPAGVVLSGGNDLVALGGDAPERDAAEAALLALCEQAGRPAIGICRGLQFMIHRSGGALVQVENHVRARHDLAGSVHRDVNSFHTWAVKSVGPGWEPLATAPDGTVELAISADGRQQGVMWHPEREAQFSAEDIALFKRFLDGSGR